MSKQVREVCNELDHRQDVKDKILKLIVEEYDNKKKDMTISFVKGLLNEIIRDFDNQPFKIDYK